jgi:hypothetical protein
MSTILENAKTMLHKLEESKATMESQPRYQSVEELYKIQEFMWDHYPAIEYYEGKIKALETQIAGAPYDQTIVDYLIKYIGKNIHPGFPHGYYAGLVESGQLANDKTAEKIQEEFDKRKRYFQIVKHP